MRPVAAVFVGGAFGSALRLVVDLLLPPSGSGFPVGTLGINLAGSFALGVLVAGFWPRSPAWLRAGLGPGLLGSFTTFSALAVSAVDLTAAGAVGTAVAYIAASVVGGIAAAALGIRVGAPTATAPPPSGPEE